MYYSMMNSDTLRKNNRYPILGDNNILEKTLTRIGAYTNPNNLYFGSNKNIWGSNIPIEMIYQDMLEGIKTYNNKFLIKSEYLLITPSDQTPTYDISKARNIGLEMFLLFTKDELLHTPDQRVLITPYYYPDGSIEVYYTMVGFNPIGIGSYNYFAYHKMGAISHNREVSLYGIISKFFGTGTLFGKPQVYPTYSKKKITPSESMEYIKSLEEENPYKDKPIDYNILNLYKSLLPAISYSGPKEFKNIARY